MCQSARKLAIALLLCSAMPCSSDDFAAQMVAAHNAWRSKVKVPPLQWSNELAKFAQQWADHLKQKNSCDMQHRNRGSESMLAGKQTGENLAWKWSSEVPASGFLYTPQEAVDEWGGEVKFFDAATGLCKGGVCGHYTQLVWRNTTGVGCGRASCGTSEIWVCNYLPAGNWIGQKPY